MVKLIALDMDGTTLNDNHEVSERNIRAIRAAQDKGIEVILLTGRSYADASLIMKKTQLELAYLCSNGAEMRDQNGEIISTFPMPKKDVLEIVSLFQRSDVFLEVYINDYIYTDSYKKQIETILKIAQATSREETDLIIEKMNERNAAGFIKETNNFAEVIELAGNEVYKIFALSDDLGKINDMNKALMKYTNLAVSSSGVGNIEITDAKAQKGIALETYAKLKGISLNETMVIGDSYNDLSMMKIAGLAIAMGNAPDDIKKCCHEVTATNVEDGVAVAIEKIVQK